MRRAQSERAEILLAPIVTGRVRRVYPRSPVDDVRRERLGIAPDFVETIEFVERFAAALAEDDGERVEDGGKEIGPTSRRLEERAVAIPFDPPRERDDRGSKRRGVDRKSVV